MNCTKWEQALDTVFIIVIGLVLCGAYAYQLVTNESPCPLCLLQRLAMIGITVGCMLNLKFGINSAHYGLILLSACFGSVVSLRQIGLHVCPKFSTFGQPVFGFSLYTWAFFVFISSILATSLLLYMHGNNKDPEKNKPARHLMHRVAYVFITLVTLTEVITTLNLCGLSACQG